MRTALDPTPVMGDSLILYVRKPKSTFTEISYTNRLTLGSPASRRCQSRRGLNESISRCRHIPYANS
jgi:hypothetical protein